MSGGYYNYQHQTLGNLADDIERDFKNNGKYKPDSDYALDKNMEDDRLWNTSPQQRLVILQEVNQIIVDLRACEIRAKELDWYLSGDTGTEFYLQWLQEQGHIRSNPTE